MQAGDTAYKNVNGTIYQCALFPLDYMYCTQISGPGEYSHCCGTATDWKGSSAIYPYYAPVDCHRTYLGGSDNIAMYVSDDLVLTPSGIRYLAFLFMHDDNPPAATTFQQGDLIGHTGTTGNVTGDHVHLDQCLKNSISLANSGITCQSGTDCWYVVDGVKPELAYFITGQETQVQLLGQNFQTVGGYTPGPLYPVDAEGLIWLIIGSGAGRKRRFGFGTGRR